MSRFRTHHSVPIGPITSVIAIVLVFANCGCSNQNDAIKKWQSQSGTSKRQQELVKGEDRPATPKTTYAYARVLAAQHNDMACDRILTSLLTQNPKFREAYLLQAEVRVRMRRITDAIHTLRVAMRYFPKDDVILNNLGMCLLIKGDCNTALGCFTQAAAEKPSNSRYRANMALTLGLLGRRDESDSLYKMVVSKEDSDHNLTVLNSARSEYLGLPEAPPVADPAVQAGTVPANSQPGTPIPQRSAPIVIQEEPPNISYWSFLSGTEPISQTPASQPSQ